MGSSGLARVCLRDKVRRVSGLTRPWRAPALLAALESEPETVSDLLLAAQRFFAGHPFAATAYDGVLGSVRRVRLDARYTEAPAGHGRMVIDLEARRARYEVRGTGWRRRGWLYYHDGETFTRRRVDFRMPDLWPVEGLPEDTTPAVEWNGGGPEPFAFLLPPERA
jgi:hypothetical protein